MKTRTVLKVLAVAGGAFAAYVACRASYVRGVFDFAEYAGNRLSEEELFEDDEEIEEFLDGSNEPAEEDDLEAAFNAFFCADQEGMSPQPDMCFDEEDAEDPFADKTPRHKEPVHTPRRRTNRWFEPYKAE